MGKIVKFCAACEEGFAEKFGFCPNCGAQLSAFELNPVQPPVEEPKAAAFETSRLDADAPGLKAEAAEAPVEDAPLADAPPLAASPALETEPTIETRGSFEDDYVEHDLTADEPAPSAEPEFRPAAAGEAAGAGLYEATHQRPNNDFQASTAPHYVPDDSFHVTVVEDSAGKTRNYLLLGAAVLTLTAFSSGVVYSMFGKYIDIAAIDTPELVAFVDDVDDPTPIEEPEPIKEEDKDAGGGGGGGKEEPTPASKGREATQVENPLFAPSARMTQVTKPEIAIQAATEGNRQAPITNEAYGLRNGIDGLSDGQGSGGGLGNGRGRGQGNGNGTGLGNGNGSGVGNGNGNGNGNGRGDGNQDDADNIVVKKGETVGLKIIAKPRATYTDAARQAQVTGTVVLRVTFLASGQVGSISPVRGLPNGLTEQAIAAARGIRFEPAKRNGQPVAVTKTIEYSFTIY